MAEPAPPHEIASAALNRKNSRKNSRSNSRCCSYPTARTKPKAGTGTNCNLNAQEQDKQHIELQKQHPDLPEQAPPHESAPAVHQQKHQQGEALSQGNQYMYKWGVPQNGCFTVENPRKNWWFVGTTRSWYNSKCLVMTWPSNSKCIVLTSLRAILSALPRYHRDTILSDSHHDLRILSARGSQYIYTYIYIYIYIYIHIHTHTYTYMHKHSHTYTYIHIHTYTYMHIHPHTCTYMHIHAHTCTYMHIHAHTCTYIHACMHACMHACIHTHIHTYIHTYIYIYTGWWFRTFFIFPVSWDDDPIWLIFFRGVETTN